MGSNYVTIDFDACLSANLYDSTALQKLASFWWVQGPQGPVSGGCLFVCWVGWLAGWFAGLLAGWLVDYHWQGQ